MVLEAQARAWASRCILTLTLSGPVVAFERVPAVIAIGRTDGSQTGCSSDADLELDNWPASAMLVMAANQVLHYYLAWLPGSIQCKYLTDFERFMSTVESSLPDQLLHFACLGALAHEPDTIKATEASSNMWEMLKDSALERLFTLMAATLEVWCLLQDIYALAASQDSSQANPAEHQRL